MPNASPKHRRRKTDKPLRDAVRRAAGDRCHLCGFHVLAAYGTVDHLTPSSSGGSTLLANSAWAHKVCNQWRGKRLLSAALRAEIRERYVKEIVQR